jgi:hypothetical protein
MGASRKRGWLTMDTKCIKLLLQFDIENCYYRVADGIVRQVYGVPMGSPPSPPVAATVCAFYEHPFCETELPQTLMECCDPRDEVIGCRFADDKIDFFVMTADTAHLADDLFDHISTIYHDSMVMEETELDDTCFKFLGYDVHIASDGRHIDLSLHNPNLATVSANLPQKKARFPRADAPSSVDSKRSTAIGALISASRAASTDDLFFKSSKTLIREFISLGYTKTFLRTAAQKAMTKEQNTRRWHMLRKTLRS